MFPVCAGKKYKFAAISFLKFALYIYAYLLHIHVHVCVIHTLNIIFQVAEMVGASLELGCFLAGLAISSQGHTVVEPVSGSYCVPKPGT